MLSQRNFVPEKFVIFNTNNQETCFMWNDIDLVVFPYSSGDVLSPRKYLTAPGKIRDVQYSKKKNEVYVLCRPSGIYELSKDDYSFNIYSGKAIALISTTSHLLTLVPGHDSLYLVDKEIKHRSALFHLAEHREIRVLSLFAAETNANFRKVLSPDSFKRDFCLITSGKSVHYVCYYIENKDPRLVSRVIYSGDFDIVELAEIRKGREIAGVSFLTKTSTLILAYAESGSLKFEKVDLQLDVRAFCVGFSANSEDLAWIISSGDEKTYHLFKRLNDDEVKVASEVENTFRCLKIHKFETLVNLLSKKGGNDDWLWRVLLKDVETLEIDLESGEMTTLKPRMLEGVDSIVERICDRAEELRRVNDEFLEAKDLTKRINMYTLKRRISCVPKMHVETILGQTFVVVDFQKNLPRNTQTILCLKLGERCLFSVKNVVSDGVMKLVVPSELLTMEAKIGIDSVVARTEKGPWCLVKDFVQDPVQRKENKRFLDEEKLNFLNKKLSVLKKLIRDEKIDMKTLSEMHKSIRRELTDV